MATWAWVHRVTMPSVTPLTDVSVNNRELNHDNVLCSGAQVQVLLVPKSLLQYLIPLWNTTSYPHHAGSVHRDCNLHLWLYFSPVSATRHQLAGIEILTVQKGPHRLLANSEDSYVPLISSLSLSARIPWCHTNLNQFEVAATSWGQQNNQLLHTFSTKTL